MRLSTSSQLEPTTTCCRPTFSWPVPRHDKQQLPIQGSNSMWVHLISGHCLLSSLVPAVQFVPLVHPTPCLKVDRLHPRPAIHVSPWEPATAIPFLLKWSTNIPGDDKHLKIPLLMDASLYKQDGTSHRNELSFSQTNKVCDANSPVGFHPFDNLWYLFYLIRILVNCQYHRCERTSKGAHPI